MLLAALRLGGGFTTGQIRDDALRRVNGGRMFAEWLAQPWRLGGGLRLLTERDTEDGVRRARAAGAALAGWDAPWVHVAAGVGHAERLLPAFALRLGPRDLVFAEASLLDLGAWSPGPGLARAGLGAAHGGGRIWAGWAWDEHGGGGLGLAGVVSLSDRLALEVGAAVDPRRPSDYVQIETLLSVRFGD